MPYLPQRIPDAIEATDTATDDGRCPTAEKGSGLTNPTPAARCPTASRRNAAPSWRRTASTASARPVCGGPGNRLRPVCPPTALPRGPGADSTVIRSASNRTSHSAGGAIGWRTGTGSVVSS